MSRSQTHQLMRGESEESPANRNLSATRTLSFAWKLTENGLLNLSGTYSLNISSTLVNLETDSLGNQRTFSSILRDLFFQDQLIGFGHDISYGQNIDIQTHPRILELLNLNKYFTLTAHYGVSYRWQNSLQNGDLGKGASWSNSISFGSEVSLKQFVETWFPTKKRAEGPQGQTQNRSHLSGRGRGHQDDEELRDFNHAAVRLGARPIRQRCKSCQHCRDSTKARDTAAVSKIQKTFFAERKLS